VHIKINSSLLKTEVNKQKLLKPEGMSREDQNLQGKSSCCKACLLEY